MYVHTNGTLLLTASVGGKRENQNATRAGYRIEREGGTFLAAVRLQNFLGIQPRVKSLRSSYPGLYPWRMTGVTLHGTVSPEV